MRFFGTSRRFEKFIRQSRTVFKLYLGVKSQLKKKRTIGNSDVFQMYLPPWNSLRATSRNCEIWFLYHQAGNVFPFPHNRRLVFGSDSNCRQQISGSTRPESVCTLQHYIGKYKRANAGQANLLWWWYFYHGTFRQPAIWRGPTTDLGPVQELVTTRSISRLRYGRTTSHGSARQPATVWPKITD